MNIPFKTSKLLFIFVLVIAIVGSILIIGFLRTQYVTRYTFDNCYSVVSKKQAEAEKRTCDLNKKNDGSCFIPNVEVDKIYSEYVHGVNICYRTKVNDLKKVNECLLKYPKDEKEEGLCYLNMFPTIH